MYTQITFNLKLFTLKNVFFILFLSITLSSFAQKDLFEQVRPESIFIETEIIEKLFVRAFNSRTDLIENGRTNYVFPFAPDQI